MSSSIDPYAELASLFLTDGADDAPESIPIDAHRGLRRGEAAHVMADDVPLVTPIEVAIVGHLPVMGGLWLTQYADQVARREGPTALVRLERGQVTFELLRADGHRGLFDGVMSPEEAFAALGPVARRWIVCAQNEAAVDGPLPGDALSILTGGDDAATVAAYRMLKSFAERWHLAGWNLPPIGLVVLGASPDRVEEVAEKLDRTTKAFLSIDLAVVAQYQRMDSIDSASRRVFQGVEFTVAEACRRIRQPREYARRLSDVRDPLGATIAKLAPKAIGRDVQRYAPVETRVDHDDLQNAIPLDAPPMVLRPAPPLPETPDDRAGVHPSAEPFADVAARDEAATDEVIAGPAHSRIALAGELTGLTPLSMRCPHQPDVELAHDADGRLHLVVLDLHLAALRPAEAWARAHMDLLRAAFPAIAAHDQGIVIDVVTFDAPSIVPLHGTGLRLHLLVETPAGSVHVPLNRLVQPSQG